jgi:hypothetical protein
MKHNTDIGSQDCGSHVAQSTSGRPGAIYPMGPLEDLLRFAYDKFQGDSTSAIIARVKGLIQEEPLERALLMLQRRHPKLRARICVNADGLSCFEVLESPPVIPLRVKDFETDNVPWQAETIESISAKLSTETGPLCQVKVLRNLKESSCDVIIVFHHSIMDGIAAVQGVDDLLTYYAWVAEAPQKDSLPNQRIEPLPFISALVPPITASVLERLEIFARLCRFFYRKRWGSWTSLPTDTAAWAPYWNLTVLSVEDTMALLRRCREKETTLFGGLFAAALSSLATAMEGKTFRFACRCPVNVRRTSGYEISNEHLGCFVSGLDKVYKIRKPFSFWDLARRGRQDVQRFVAKQGPALTLKLSGYQKLLHPSRIRRDTLSIDNIGVADVKGDYGDLSLEACSFVVRNKNVGVPLMVIFITVQGRLNITIGAANVTASFRQRFEEEFFNTLYGVIHAKI